MTLAIDKTLKICLYADVIENDILPLFEEVEEKRGEI